MDHFNKLKSGSYGGLVSGLDSDEVKTAMEDNQLILIGTSTDHENTTDAAKTLNHEEVAHGIDKLDGDKKSMLEDHKGYFGTSNSDGTSPSDQKVQTDPKFKDSKAKQQFDEIDKIIKEEKEIE